MQETCKTCRPKCVFQPDGRFFLFVLFFVKQWMVSVTFYIKRWQTSYDTGIASWCVVHHLMSEVKLCDIYFTIFFINILFKLFEAPGII